MMPASAGGLVAEIQAALIECSQAGGGSLPPGAAALAMRLELLDPVEALENARRRPAGWQKAEALAALAPRLPPALGMQALAVAQSIPEPSHRLYAIAQLLAILPPGEQVQARAGGLALLPQVPLLDARARLLAGLLATAGVESRTAWLETIEADLDAAGETSLTPGLEAAEARAELFALAGAPLQERWLPSILAVIASGAYQGECAWILRRLLDSAPARFQPRLLREIEPCLAGAVFPLDFISAVVALGPYLAGQAKTRAARQVLRAVRSIADPEKAARALQGLAPYLPPAQVRQALQLADRLEGSDCQARAWLALAPSLPPGERQALVARARAGLAPDDRAWDSLLDLLLSLLPTDQQRAMLQDLLRAAPQAHQDGDERGRLLESLLPYLPPESLPAALAAAPTLPAGLARAFYLAHLAHRLPAELQPAAIQALLDETAGLVDARPAAVLLRHPPPALSPAQEAAARAQLARPMPDWERAEIEKLFGSERRSQEAGLRLQAPGRITDPLERALELAVLLPDLPAGLQGPTRAEIRSLAGLLPAAGLARLLFDLAAHLPAPGPNLSASHRAGPTESAWEAVRRALETWETLDEPATRQDLLRQAAVEWPGEILRRLPPLPPALARQLDACARQILAGQIVERQAHDEQNWFGASRQAAARRHVAVQTGLAVFLSNPGDRRRCLESLLISLEHVWSHQDRRRLLARLSAALPEDLWRETAQSILEKSRPETETYRMWTLFTLAEFLPSGLLPAAQELGETIGDPFLRRRAGLFLAARLPAGARGARLCEALSALASLDHDSRSRLMDDLAPILPAWAASYPEEAGPALLQALHACAALERRDFYAVLAFLLPNLLALPPEGERSQAAAGIFQAVEETAARWP